MKTSNKFFFLFLLVGFPVLLVAAQTEFVWQNPKPQGNSLYGMQFISVSIGWAVGNNGTIMKTTDGGKNWVFQSSNTTAALTGVHFINSQTGWAVGANTVIKTVNGGDNWSVMTTSAPTALNAACFFDENTGILAGYGMVLRTTDGGKTFTTVASASLLNYASMLSVFFVNNRLGWSVGTKGKIIHTED